MGKFTEAIRKATEDRLIRIEKLDHQEQVKYEFVVRKTTDSKIDPRVVTYYDDTSPVTEQYRVLRTNMSALSPEKPLRSITVTSSTFGEGKTLSAINLAFCMAHDLDQKKVLLIDADMRRSRVSRYLGLPSYTGLSEVLSGQAKLEETLLDFGIANLTLLPSGKTPQNAAELLGSAKMKEAMAQLKALFDFIIVDAPPIVPVTDAGLIGNYTDGVILVVQAGRTQKGVINHAESLLRQVQAKLLGYVLTNIKYHIPDYIYRYL